MNQAYERITKALAGIAGQKRKVAEGPDGDGGSPAAGPSKKPTHRRIVFRPWDQKDMLNRLETFRPLTWFSKPEIVGPIACASRGYYNEARDQLCCEFCGVRLLYPQVPFEARPRAAALFAEQLASKHEAHCPWRSTRSGESVLAFVPDTCPATSPPGLCASYQARLDALACMDALPELYPRAVQRLAAIAASAAVRPPTKANGFPSPGIPGLRKVLGLHSQGGSFIAGLSGGNGAGTPVRPQQVPNSQSTASHREGKGAQPHTPTQPAASPSSVAAAAAAAGLGSPQLLPVTPQGLTFMQRARALALLGWEVEELLGLDGSTGPSHSSTQVPQVYWPSASAYALAHLVGALDAGQAHSPRQPSKRRLCMQNVALKCPTCKSRVGLWNFVPKAPLNQPAASTPGRPGISTQPSPHLATTQPPAAPAASLFKTIAGGSYNACAQGASSRASLLPAPRFGASSSSKPVFGLAAFSVEDEGTSQTGPQAPSTSTPAPATGHKRKAGEESREDPVSTPQSGQASQQQQQQQQPEGPGAKRPRRFFTSPQQRQQQQQQHEEVAGSAGSGTPARTATGQPSTSKQAAGGSHVARAVSPGAPSGPGRLGGCGGLGGGAGSRRASGGGAANSGGSSSGGGMTDSFDLLSYHRSWCPWVFTGHSDHPTTTDGPRSPPKAPKVKCGWLHLLAVLCAPPAPQQHHHAAPAQISASGTPGPSTLANGSGLGSSSSTPHAARAAAFFAGAAEVGNVDGTTGGSQQAAAVAGAADAAGAPVLPGSSAEVEQLLVDTSGDRKDMRALKDSILHNLRRS